MSGPLLIPVCTFGRVFDTVPLREVLTLPELTAALRRFEVKTGTAGRIERDVSRIEKARGLLERTRVPVNQIGWNVGYQDPSAFSRVFRAVTGLTAGEYRNRFGVLARRADG